MNGKQIENVMLLIDDNIAIARSEAAQYVLTHQAEIVRSLEDTGSATVRTSAGDLKLTVQDLENLEAAAA